MVISIVANLYLTDTCNKVPPPNQCQTPEMRRLPRIASHKFFYFYIKKCDLTNIFNQFHSTVLFSISFCLKRACFTHLISSNLSYNLCLWYYDRLVTLIKKLMQTYIVKISGSILNLSTVQFKWHLTPHMTLSIETCIRRTPCIKRTLQHSPRVSA